MPSAASSEANAAASGPTTRAEATSLAGKPLYRPAQVPNAAKLEADLAQARKHLAANPDDPDALIWVGRREGYLWRYQDSLATFTQGIERYPDNPRFYRHRGHRYLTLRQFDKAQADFERGADLMLKIPDEIEPAVRPSGGIHAARGASTLDHLGWRIPPG